MGVLPFNLADLPISFDHVASPLNHLTQQLNALRDHLLIEPRYTAYCDRTLWTSRGLTKSATYAGHGGVIKLKRSPGRDHTAYAILYRFVLCDALGEPRGWSGDLDDSPTLPPLEVWFRDDDGPLQPDDALIAAIKALIPKKPRAKKTP